MSDDVGVGGFEVVLDFLEVLLGGEAVEDDVVVALG